MSLVLLPLSLSGKLFIIALLGALSNEVSGLLPRSYIFLAHELSKPLRNNFQNNRH